MKVEVSTSIEELRKQFETASFAVREDGQGGAYVLMENIVLGPKYMPSSTWLGFQISAQYPYADIYPVFVGADIARVDKKEFVAPVTRGHTFEGRSAIQISRRNTAAQTSGLQKASTKILKVIDFMEKLI
jgi:hypothetical protein